MVSKVTGSLVLLGATIFTIPVYAAPPAFPATQAAAVQAQAPSQVEMNNPAVPAAAQDPEPGKPSKAPPESTDLDSLDLSYAKGVVVDAGKIATSPLRWDGSDWLKAGAVVGATGALFLIDQKVKNFARDHQNDVASRFAWIGNAQGTPIYILPALGSLYGYGALADDHKARRVSLLALESYALSGTLTEGIKALAGRHRPNTGDSSHTWDGPSTKNASFSSGHTASAFSIATVFANEYKDNAWVPPVAYGLATLTGLSRIYSNEHWASDVFFGGAVGYFVSKAVLNLHKDDKKNPLAGRLTVVPSVSKELTGVSMSYKF